MLCNSKKILFAVFTFMLLFNTNTLSQDVKVPLEIQFALLPKVLMLEKSLAVQDEKIKIAIIYDASIRSSIRMKDKILSFIENQSYKKDNTKFNFVTIDLANEADLSETLKESNIDAVYLTPLKSENITLVSFHCKNLKLISFTGVEKYLDYGISILFDIKNKKPKITINLESAKEEGASFSSYLLRLVNIINNS